MEGKEGRKQMIVKMRVEMENRHKVQNKRAKGKILKEKDG